MTVFDQVGFKSEQELPNPEQSEQMGLSPPPASRQFDR